MRTVLHITPSGNTRSGGPYRYVHNLVSAPVSGAYRHLQWQSPDDRSTVAALANRLPSLSAAAYLAILRAQKGRASGLVDRLLRPNALADLQAGRAWRRALVGTIEQVRPDIVVVHNFYTASAARSVLRKLDLRTPLVLMSHSPVDPESERWLVEHPPESLSKYLRRCVAFYAQALKDVDAIAVPDPRAMEAYFVDIPEVLELLRQKRSITVSSGVPASSPNSPAPVTPPRLLFVGRPHPNKGLERLAARLPLIIEEGWHVDLAGLDAEEGLRFGVRASEEVRLHGVTSEISSLLGQSTAFASPNRVAYFDLTVIEALSHGRPALLQRVGGHARFIDDFPGAVCEVNWNSDESVREGLRAALSMIARSATITQVWAEFFSPEALNRHWEFALDELDLTKA